MDGITLDCAGKSVIGSGSGTGILLSGRTGVTITNCQVANFEMGIELISSSGNTLTDNTADGNSRGFRLSTSSDNTLTGNTAEGNVDGFLVSFNSVGNTITGNAIITNDHGIHICRSLLPPQNTIFPNQFVGPQQAVFVEPFS